MLSLCLKHISAASGFHGYCKKLLIRIFFAISCHENLWSTNFLCLPTKIIDTNFVKDLLLSRYEEERILNSIVFSLNTLTTYYTILNLSNEHIYQLSAKCSFTFLYIIFDFCCSFFKSWPVAIYQNLSRIIRRLNQW